MMIMMTNVDTLKRIVWSVNRNIIFQKGCPLVDLFNEQNDIKTEIIYYCVDLDYGYGVFVKEKLYRIDKSGNMLRIPG